MYNSLMDNSRSSGKDCGEMFLDFLMHNSILKYTGIYLGDIIIKIMTSKIRYAGYEDRRQRG